MSDPLSQETPSAKVSSQAVKSVNEIAILLLAVSALMVLGTALLQLDFLIAVLLGSSVICLNFFLTRHVLFKVILNKDLKRRLLALYAVKFGLSGMVLYGAVVHFKLPGFGILIGVSNIAIAIFIYSIKHILFPATEST